MKTFLSAVLAVCLFALPVSAQNGDDGDSGLEGESSIEGVKREVGKELGIDLAEIMLKGAMMYEYEDVCHIGYSW